LHDINVLSLVLNACNVVALLLSLYPIDRLFYRRGVTMLKARSPNYSRIYGEQLSRS